MRRSAPSQVYAVGVLLVLALVIAVFTTGREPAGAIVAAPAEAQFYRGIYVGCYRVTVELVPSLSEDEVSVYCYAIRNEGMSIDAFGMEGGLLQATPEPSMLEGDQTL